MNDKEMIEDELRTMGYIIYILIRVVSTILIVMYIMLNVQLTVFPIFVSLLWAAVMIDLQIEDGILEFILE